MTSHADFRLDQRYRMSHQSFRDAYIKAIKIKNYIIGNNKEKGRATVLFSSNRSFLHKVVISKTDGAIITVLPVLDADFKLANHEGLIDRQ